MKMDVAALICNIWNHTFRRQHDKIPGPAVVSFKHVGKSLSPRVVEEMESMFKRCGANVINVTRNFSDPNVEVLTLTVVSESGKDIVLPDAWEVVKLDYDPVIDDEGEQTSDTDAVNYLTGADLPFAPIECKGDGMKATQTQVSGDHYKNLPIQPIDYIAKNGLGYMEGNIIKYVTCYPHKNGVEDLKKARHYLDMLIESLGKDDTR